MEITVGGLRQADETIQSSHVHVSEQQKKTGEETGKQQETIYDAVSEQGDTLSISEEGKAENAKMNSASEGKETTDGIVIKKEVKDNVQEQESDLSTINLSTYTESELRQMYLDGDITKSEYDEEINSRERKG